MFLDGSMTCAGRWAPWSRLAGFAVWSPGRTPSSGPRTSLEEDFLEYRWDPGGLLQWAVVQGRWQTVARAEDMAALAGLLGPEPAAMASDSASTVGFLQKLTRGEAHTKSLGGPMVTCARPSTSLPPVVGSIVSMFTRSRLTSLRSRTGRVTSLRAA